MATSLASGNATTNKLWGKDLEDEMIRKIHFFDNIGEEGSDALVWKYSEFGRGKGDQITVNFLELLTGVGRGEGERQEGFEEDQVVTYDQFVINELKHAVRNKANNTISAQRAEYWPKLLRKSKTQLAKWHAVRRESAFFGHLCGNTATSFSVEGTTYSGTDRLKALGNNYATAPTTNRILRAGGQATDQAITSADKISLPFIDAMLETALTAGSFRMQPTKKGFILYLPTEAITDLRRDTTSAIQWMDYELAKISSGKEQPNLYAHEVGIYNGIVRIMRSDYLPAGVNSSNSAQVSNTKRIALCGKGAIGLGYPQGDPNLEGSAMTWREKDFDYEDEVGVQAKDIFGMKKLVVNGEDHAVVTGTIYAAAHTS